MGEMMQVYWVELRGDSVQKCQPGQYVGTEDGEVGGFVAEVDRVNERALFYLFEPRPARPDVTVVHATIPDEVWAERLGDILEVNPNLRRDWKALPISAQRN